METFDAVPQVIIGVLILEDLAADTGTVTTVVPDANRRNPTIAAKSAAVPLGALRTFILTFSFCAGIAREA
jgi:hypothetical protein